MIRRLSTLMMVCAIGTPVAAQWLKEPTKGIPRTADGKPNLSAPADDSAVRYIVFDERRQARIRSRR